MAAPGSLYFPSHTSLGNHPKLIKLSRRLGVSKTTCVGLLNYFWWWAMTYAPDGDVSRFSNEDIAIGAEWDGDETVFVSALTDAGFLDSGTIHDWDEYGGRLFITRDHNATRKARSRDNYVMSPTGHSDVTVTSQAKPVTLKERRGEENKKKPTVSKKREQTSIPEDWQPSEQSRAIAAKYGMPDSEIEDQVFKMKRNYEQRGAVTASPAASWATWCSNYPSFRKPSNGYNKPARTVPEYTNVEPY